MVRWLTLPLALAVEIASAAQILPASPGWSGVLSAIGAHAGACALFGWASTGRRDATTDRARQLLAGAVAFLGYPLFGMVAILSGSVASAAVSHWQRRSLSAANIDPHPRATSPTSRRRVDLLAPLEVEPLVDLLHGCDADLKRGAIEVLVSTRGCRAAALLQPLLHDDDAEIRLYASIRLCSLEDDIGQAILAARAATDEHASNAATWQRLAHVYTEYTTSGLLDGATARQYLGLAEAAYESALRLRPGQHELALALGRAWLSLGALDTARTYLEHATRAGNAEVATNARLGLMDIAFRSGSITEVVDQATAARGKTSSRHPWRGFVEWWAAAV
jgi:tetratricopeptide (TPR) repeat protein